MLKKIEAHAERVRQPAEAGIGDRRCRFYRERDRAAAFEVWTTNDRVK